MAPEPTAEFSLADVGWPAATAQCIVGVLLSAVAGFLVHRWLTPRIRSHAPPPPWLAELGLLALILLLASRIVLPYLLAWFPSAAPNEPPQMSTNLVVASLGNVAIAAFVVFLGVHGRGGQGADFGLRGTSARGITLGLLLLVACAPAFLGLSVLVAKASHAIGLDPRQQLVRALAEDDSLRESLLVVLAIVAIAPVLEELLFRGILQGALRASVGPVAAVLGSSLVFAVSHDLQSSPLVFVLAVALGTAYETTRSLVPSIVAHAAFNGLQLWTIQRFVGS